MAITTLAQGKSFVQYTADGVAANFPLIFAYLDPTNVKVYVGSTEVSYTFLNASEVTPTVKPTIGQIVTCRRFTQSTSRLVDFTDGGQLSEKLLDKDSDQLFYLAQESQDVSSFGLGVDPLNFTVDARGNRVINMADAINPTDGISFRQINTLVTTVATASSNASAAAASAATSLTAANTASTAATTAQASADAVLGVAAGAVSTVNTHTANFANPHAVTKTQVGLSNVDNTSDANKPVSSAQAVAIAQAKADLVNSSIAALDTLSELASALGNDASFSTTMSTSLGNRLRHDTASQGLSVGQKTNAKTNIDLQNVDNTNDAGKPISTAALAALNLKTSITGGSVITPTRLDMKQDTLANLLTYAASATNGQLVFATDAKATYVIKDNTLSAVGGAGGGINYVTSSDADSGLGNWVTFADGAAIPVDGIGGTPNSTFVVSPNTSMRGTSNFLFTKNAGATRLGEGFSYPFTIDPSDAGKVLQISLEYLVSGTYTDDDLQFYVYYKDATNFRMIQPAPFKIKNSGIVEKFGMEFQTQGGAGATYNYQLIAVHTTANTANAYAVRFDNISVGPQGKVMGSAITDPAPYTATLTNLGNATAVSSWYKSGSYLLIENVITIGSTLPTGAIAVSIPSQFTNSTPYTVNGIINNSTVKGLANGSGATYVGSPRWDNTNKRIDFLGGNGQGFWGTTVPFTWVVGDVIAVSLKIPMTGWASSTILSSDAATSVVAASVKGATTSLVWNTATTVIYPTVSRDANGSYDSTTGIYTVKIPGDYFASALMQSSASITPLLTRIFQVSIVSTTDSLSSYFPVQTTTTLNNWQATASGVLYNLKAGDTIKVVGFQNLDASSAMALNGASNNFSVYRLASPAQIAASDSVSALYTGAPPTIVSGTLAAASAVLSFSTKVKDTHNAYTSATGVFTVPTSGIYDIQAFTSQSGTYVLNSQSELMITIDGVVKAEGIVTVGGAVNTAQPIVNLKSYPLLAGQLVRVLGYNSGSSITFAAAATQNQFSITRTGNY